MKIVNGSVKQFDGGVYSGRVDAGILKDGKTQLIAKWTDGNPLIAVRFIEPDKVTVALNFVIGSSDAHPQMYCKKTDGAIIVYNSIVYAYKNCVVKRFKSDQFKKKLKTCQEEKKAC